MDILAPGLAFEQPIFEIETRLHQLERSADGRPETENDIRRLRRELAETTKKIYGQLDPWQTVQVARHKNRPYTADYLGLAFDEFVELHGDRNFGDDRPC